MCGRFAQSKDVGEYKSIFGARNPFPQDTGYQPNFNLAPSHLAAVVRLNPENAEPHLFPLSWGYLPYWEADFKAAKRPINARAETVESSRMFGFAKHRCLIPAEAWYEWRVGEGRAKIPYAFARPDRETMAFGGVWTSWKAPGIGKIIRSFAILTTAANRTCAGIHDRMPLIVAKEKWGVWLGSSPGDLQEIMAPPPEDAIEFWKVDRAVGNVRNNGSQLLTPLAD